MSTPQFILVLENDVKAGWTWVENEFMDGYNLIKSVVVPDVLNFAMSVEQDFYGAAVTVVTKLQAAITTPTNLGDLETALLNVAEGLGTEVLSMAQTMGSQALQTLLGLIQMKLVAKATATAA